MARDDGEQLRAGGGFAPPWREELSDRSDRPDVREEIGRLIREGRASVRPRPGDPDRVDVIPIGRQQGPP